MNEQLIGIRVFSRPSTYNTAEDNIVRTHARLLRQKLEVYFSNEGKEETLRLQIPKGSYLPTFSTAETLEQSGPEKIGADAIPSSGEKAARKSEWWRPSFIWLLIGCLVGACSSWIALNHFINPSRTSHSVKSVNIFWETLFSKDRPTLIVVGDAGVLMYQNLSKSTVTMDEYAYHTYENSPYAKTPDGYRYFPLALRTYTAYNEIEPIRFLLSLPEAQGKTVKIIFARDLKADDLRHNNLIFLGGPQYDPWEQAFKKSLDFRLETDEPQARVQVVNADPQKGEQSVYAYIEGDPQRRGYGVIALTDNLSGDGRILVVAGTTALGDGMTAEFLESERDFAPILDEARSGKSMRNFGLLLKTTFAGTSWSHWELVAHRIH